MFNGKKPLVDHRLINEVNIIKERPPQALEYFISALVEKMKERYLVQGFLKAVVNTGMVLEIVTLVLITTKRDLEGVKVSFSFEKVRSILLPILVLLHMVV